MLLKDVINEKSFWNSYLNDNSITMKLHPQPGGSTLCNWLHKNHEFFFFGYFICAIRHHYRSPYSWLKQCSIRRGSLHVWLPMRPFRFVIALFFSAALWPLTEMITRDISWEGGGGGKSRAIRKADNLAKFICRTASNPGRLKLLEP
jgi:hypothetical protein